MRNLTLACSCVALVGCAISAASHPPVDESADPYVAGAAGAGAGAGAGESMLDNPPEVYINPKGVRFRLVGPATVGPVPPGGLTEPTMPDHGDVQALEANPTLDELAEQLRPVMLMGGRWEYVGEEPAYELAESILRNEVLVEKTAPREGRRIVGATCGAGNGPCDNRQHNPGLGAALSGYAPSTFVESGCSGTMIDRSTLVTAAHCLYNTKLNHWLVMDGSSCENGGEAGGNSGEDRRDGTGNTQNCMPRFAAGMSDAGPWLGWMSCYFVVITTAFRDAADLNAAALPQDYAVVDFNTNFCANDYPGDLSGWRGTWIATTAQLASQDGAIIGYPGQTKPGFPDNSVDPLFGFYTGSGIGFPVRVTPTNCGALNGSKGTEADSYIPCATAMQVGMAGGPGSFKRDPVGNGAWQIGTNTLDATAGQSGSGYILYGTPAASRTLPSEAVNQYIVGIHSGSNTSWNLGRTWDATVSNFVTTYSNFPTTF